MRPSAFPRLWSDRLPVVQAISERLQKAGLALLAFALIVVGLPLLDAGANTPGLEVTLTADPAGSVVPGETLTYTYRVFNGTAGTLAGLDLVADLPDGSVPASTAPPTVVRAFTLESADDFTSATLDGSSGSHAWTGSWTSVSGTGEPVDGVTQTTIDGDPALQLTGNGAQVSRTVDLSTFPAAYLSYRFKRIDLPGQATVGAFVSDPETGTHVRVDEFSGVGDGFTDPGWETTTVDISGLAGVETEIVFLVDDVDVRHGGSLALESVAIHAIPSAATFGELPVLATELTLLAGDIVSGTFTVTVDPTFDGRTIETGINASGVDVHGEATTSNPISQGSPVAVPEATLTTTDTAPDTTTTTTSTEPVVEVPASPMSRSEWRGSLPPDDSSSPLVFKPNSGQATGDLDFIARASGYVITLEHGGAVLALGNGNAPHEIRMTFPGSAPTPTKTASGLAASPTDDPTYASVQYSDLYPGVDVVYQAVGRNLQYNLVVNPGADPADIFINFQGANQASIEEDGSLLVDTDAGRNLTASAPYTYQDTPSGRITIDSAYVLNPNGTISFTIGDYNTDLPLIIDPTFVAADTAGGYLPDGGTIDLPVPAGTVAGDLLIAQLAYNANVGSTIAPTAGWTVIDVEENPTHPIIQALYWRVATASEPAQYGFTLTSGKADTASGAIAAYSGVDTASPIDAFGGQSNGTSTSLLAPSITTTQAGTTMIAFFANRSNGVISPPGAMTERWDVGSDAGVGDVGESRAEAADELLAAAGATGTRTATTAASDGSVGHLVALAPAVGNPPTAVDDNWANGVHYRVPRGGTLTLDLTHSYLTEWGTVGTGDGQFVKPNSVGVDASGNVFVADFSNDRIQKLTSDGTYVSQWGTFGTGDGQFNGPAGVTVDSSGNVFVVDSGNNRIQKFDGNGTYLDQWGTLGGGNGQLWLPEQVAFDSSGNMYVADSKNNRVQKWAPSGSYLTQWATSGLVGGEFKSPEGVAIDSADNMYVVDSSNSRIHKFNSSGIHVVTWGQVGTLPGDLKGATEIVVDAYDNLYVNEDGNDRFQVFDTAGTSLEILTFSGISSPDGLGVDPSGTVYLADSNNDRVLVFSPTGSILVNDSDPDADPITVWDADIGTAGIQPLSGPTNGTLTLDADGTFTYIHDGSATSSDSFTYRATDGSGQSNIATVEISIASAPVLDSTKSPALTAIDQDSGAPVGAVGTLVSSLVDFASPAGQVDNVTDADSGALLGIAVNGADTTNGAWWFSTNGGTTWSALGAVSKASARLLAADANTRIYFQPSAGYSGTVTDAITFRAWDLTSGTNGGMADTQSVSRTWADNFNVVSYSNSNGTENWTTDWIENDSSGGGAVAGRIRVQAPELRVNSSAVGDWVYRQADLLGSLAAEFSFSLDNRLSGSDQIAVQVSGNGGASFTTLTTISSGTPSGFLSFDISSYIASNTQIRVYSLWSAGSHLRLDGLQIAATAGNDGTSAFSTATDTASLEVVAVGHHVNSTGDAGDLVPGDGVCDTGGVNTQGAVECTLRAAIEESNALAGTDAISFNIPTSESGYSASPLSYTIRPGSVGGMNLPAITDPVLVNGASQPGFAGTPIVVIDSNLGGSSDPNGLTLQAGFSTIRGLVIVNSGTMLSRWRSPEATRSQVITLVSGPMDRRRPPTVTGYRSRPTATLLVGRPSPTGTSSPGMQTGESPSITLRPATWCRATTSVWMHSTADLLPTVRTESKSTAAPPITSSVEPMLARETLSLRTQVAASPWCQPRGAGTLSSATPSRRTPPSVSTSAMTA